jgi:hypothetical protein
MLYNNFLESPIVHRSCLDFVGSIVPILKLTYVRHDSWECGLWGES